MSENQESPPPTAKPAFCVDLDHTLSRSDLSIEATFIYLKARLTNWFRLIGFAKIGLPHWKTEVAKQTELDPATLPYREEVIDWVKQAKAEGRTTCLASASPIKHVQAVADHLSIFDVVLGTDDKTNLKGKHKADALTERFGEKNFDYAGDSTADLDVWPAARKAYLVNFPADKLKAARPEVEIGECIQDNSSPVKGLIKAARTYQWVKNTLLFVPLITSHRVFEPALLFTVLLGFIAFSLCASGLYIVNDIFDVWSDRGHPRKSKRPLANGSVTIPQALIACGAMVFIGLLFGATVGLGFFALLILYCILSASYSFRLKRLLALDVVILSSLYTLRVLAGGAAAGIYSSAWLLTFSIFIFFCLALTKRYSEMRRLQGEGKDASGRGYIADDVTQLGSLGSASGIATVLVLALYIRSEEVVALYQHPNLLLLLCPILLFWMTRLWILAGRGEIDEDPILFVFHDKPSYLTGLVSVLVILAATFLP